MAKPETCVVCGGQGRVSAGVACPVCGGTGMADPAVAEVHQQMVTAGAVQAAVKRAEAGGRAAADGWTRERAQALMDAREAAALAQMAAGQARMHAMAPEMHTARAVEAADRAEQALAEVKEKILDWAFPPYQPGGPSPSLAGATLDPLHVFDTLLVRELDVWGPLNAPNFNPAAVKLPFVFVPQGATGDDFLAISNAIAALPTDAGGYTVGEIRLGPGLYKGAAQITKPIGVNLIGVGPGTVLQPQYGAAPALYSHDLIGPPGGFGSYHESCGAITDLIIDGTASGANGVGLDIGDGWGHKVQRCRIQNFTGAGAIGFYQPNRKFWTEKARYQLTLWGNTTQAVMDQISAQASSEFSDFDFDVFCLALQSACVFQNGNYLSKGRLRVMGNMVGSNTAPTGNWSALMLTGQGAGFFSQLKHSEVELQLETDTTTTYYPQTVNYGSVSNFIQDCTGNLAFSGTWTVSNLTTGSNQLSLSGEVFGDHTLNTNNVAAAGTPIGGAAPSYQGPADPVGTTSAARVMMGLGVTFTPTGTADTAVWMTAYVVTTPGTSNASVSVQTGTGTPPANGDAQTGSALTAAPTVTTVAAGTEVAVSIHKVLTGLVTGTTYWFDLSLSSANPANTATVKAIQFIFMPVA